MNPKKVAALETVDYRELVGWVKMWFRARDFIPSDFPPEGPTAKELRCHIPNISYFQQLGKTLEHRFDFVWNQCQA